MKADVLLERRWCLDFKIAVSGDRLEHVSHWRIDCVYGQQAILACYIDNRATVGDAEKECEAEGGPASEGM